MTETSRYIASENPFDLSFRLEEAGMNCKMAEIQSQFFSRCARTLNELDPVAPIQPVGYFVPGYLEVLGKHTDYAGGNNLVCAIDRGLAFLVRPRPDRMVHLIDAGRDVEMLINLNGFPPSSEVDWENYPRTVLNRLRENFDKFLLGADIVFASNLPPGIGLGSSSALMIGVLLCMIEAGNLRQTVPFTENIGGSESLACYAGCIETGQSYGMLHGEQSGMFGGSGEQVAILCGRPNSVLQFRYNPVIGERAIAMPENRVFVVASSGVQMNENAEAREKCTRLARMASHIAQLWRDDTDFDHPHLHAILASEENALGQLQAIIDRSIEEEFTRDQLHDRLRHFVIESQEIVPQAAEALEQENFKRLGRIAERSREQAEALLNNQIPETVFLANEATRLGAKAASSFGPGFGGSVWAMVEEEWAQMFMNTWRSSYYESFPARDADSQFVTISAGGPAVRVDVAAD